MSYKSRTYRIVKHERPLLDVVQGNSYATVMGNTQQEERILRIENELCVGWCFNSIESKSMIL